MKNTINQLTSDNTIRFLIAIGVLTLNALLGIGLFFFEFPIENKEFISMFLVFCTSSSSVIIDRYYRKANKDKEQHNEQN